jgi:hypothetical protein
VEKYQHRHNQGRPEALEGDAAKPCLGGATQNRAAGASCRSAFERAIVAEYLPQTPAEQELVHRLASLFWRLREATSIETGLSWMQREILQAFRNCCQKTVQTREGEGAGTCAEFRKGALVNAQGAQERDPEVCPANAASPSRDMAVSFFRLANLDNELIDRLSRYEAGLWRQLVQPGTIP